MDEYVRVEYLDKIDNIHHLYLEGLQNTELWMNNEIWEDIPICNIYYQETISRDKDKLYKVIEIESSVRKDQMKLDVNDFKGTFTDKSFETFITMCKETFVKFFYKE